MSTWQEQNAEIWAQIDFALSEQQASTVVWITCDSYHHIRTLVAEFKAHFPSRYHFEHRVTDFKDGSIPAYFRQELPMDAFAHDPASAFVHLFGLELHVGIGSEKPGSHFFESLNFEREAVFGEFPFVIVIWSDTSSQIKAQVLAPDFWDWMTEKFHFEAPPIVLEQELSFMQETKDVVAPEQRDALFHQIARQLHLLERTTQAKDKLSMLESLAENYQALQEYDKAIHYRQEVLKFELQMEPRQLSSHLNRLGIALQITGRLESALTFFTQSLKISQEISDRLGEGTSLNNIGQIYAAYGDYSTALHYFEKSLIVRSEIGDSKGEGSTLSNIGQVHFATGKFEAAMTYFERSLDAAKKIGDLSGEAVILNNISQIHDSLGRSEIAIHYLKLSLRIQEETGDRRGEAATLSNLATIQYAAGDFQSAINNFMRSLQINVENGDREGEGINLNNISQIHVSRKDFDSAANCLNQSLKIRKEIGDIPGLAYTFHNLGSLNLKQAHFEAAIPYFLQSFAIFQKLGSPNAQRSADYLNDIKTQIGETRYKEIVASLPPFDLPI